MATTTETETEMETMTATTSGESCCRFTLYVCHLLISTVALLCTPSPPVSLSCSLSVPASLFLALSLPSVPTAVGEFYIFSMKITIDSAAQHSESHARHVDAVQPLNMISDKTPNMFNTTPSRQRQMWQAAGQREPRRGKARRQPLQRNACSLCC